MFTNCAGCFRGNNWKFIMEVDTGALFFMMNLRKFNKLVDLKDLQQTSVKLGTYTGEWVNLSGVTDIEMLHGASEIHLSLLIVDSEFLKFLARNWLQKDWESQVSFEWGRISAESGYWLNLIHYWATSSAVQRLLKWSYQYYNFCMKDFTVQPI